MKYAENKYTQAKYNAKKELVKTLNTISTTYKFEFVEDPTNDSRESVALTGLIPIEVNFNEYDKKYTFFLNYQLPYVRYESYKQIAEKHNKPNQIGSLTDGKIKAWIDYLIVIYEELVQLSSERQAKVNEFLAIARANNATISKMDQSYYTCHGSIIKNGIEFEFQVYDEGYVSQDIKIHYSVKDTIENFNKLADNQYSN